MVSGHLNICHISIRYSSALNAGLIRLVCNRLPAELANKLSCQEWPLGGALKPCMLVVGWRGRTGRLELVDHHAGGA